MMRVGDLVRMICPGSACNNEIGVIINVYPAIQRNLVLFYEIDCKLACLDIELKVISENYYLDKKHARA